MIAFYLILLIVLALVWVTSTYMFGVLGRLIKKIQQNFVNAINDDMENGGNE